MENVAVPIERKPAVQTRVELFNQDNSNHWEEEIKALYEELLEPPREPQGYAAFIDWWK